MKSRKADIPIYDVALQESDAQAHEVKDFEIHRLEELTRKTECVDFPHRHSFYNLIFFTKGSGTHTIDFQTYPVEPNTFFFMSEGQVHSWELSKDVAGYTVFFTRDLCSAKEDLGHIYDYSYFHNAYSTPRLKLPEGERLDELKPLFELLTRESAKPSSFRERVLCSYLNILLTKLLEEFQCKASDGFERQRFGPIREFELLVERHFFEKRAVADYADILNLTSNYLNTLTRKAIGKNAKSVINDRVLLEAKRLLLNSEMTISEVAYKLNFKDTSYFSRFFRKQTGDSPEAFRQKHQSSKHAS